MNKKEVRDALCNSCGVVMFDYQIPGHVCHGQAASSADAGCIPPGTAVTYDQKYPQGLMPADTTETERAAGKTSDVSGPGCEALATQEVCACSNRGPVVSPTASRSDMKRRNALAGRPIELDHSCHDECQKPGCVMRRERDYYKSAIENHFCQFEIGEDGDDLIKEHSPHCWRCSVLAQYATCPAPQHEEEVESHGSCRDCGAPLENDACSNRCNGGYPSLTNGGYDDE